ncbi:hypothetical protein [Haliangium sp.]|uniref:hypothetical protein n=1 Tax=Haliangium sp. TaxID=2663208 RepID=UPI003D14B7F7
MATSTQYVLDALRSLRVPTRAAGLALGALMCTLAASGCINGDYEEPGRIEPGPDARPPGDEPSDPSNPGDDPANPGDDPSNPGDDPSNPGGSAPPAENLPAVDGECPTLVDGSTTILGTSVDLTVGSEAGPVYFYWHATGTSASEVERAIPDATDRVKASGGIVASFQSTSGRGTNTGNGVWFTGDFDAADQILACGIEQGLVDTSRIHTAGYSAGGLQVGVMTLERRYLASAISYSGGLFGLRRGDLDQADYVPAVVTAHGAAGVDTLVLDFAATSATFANEIVGAGGLAIDCDDGGGHVSLTRLGIQGRALEFFDDHPYGTAPSPYAGGLPGAWPSFCTLVDE